jgi:hypothetical protein
MIHITPEIVQPSSELLEKLEKFREEHAGDPLGGVADRVLFEDDNVKIWEMRLEPGEHSALHHHAHEYYLIIFSGDFVAGIPPKKSGEDIFVAKIPELGNTVHIPKGGTEWAYNCGEKLYHEYLVELKNA